MQLSDESRKDEIVYDSWLRMCSLVGARRERVEMSEEWEGDDGGERRGKRRRVQRLGSVI